MNCTIPALVSSSEGSSGIREEDGMRLQPLLSKNFKYFSRISALVMYSMCPVFLTYALPYNGARAPYCRRIVATLLFATTHLRKGEAR